MFTYSFEHFCNSCIMITLAWAWFKLHPIAIFLLKSGVMLARAAVHTKKYNKKYFSYVDIFESIVDTNPEHISFITVEDQKEYKNYSPRIAAATVFPVRALAIGPGYLLRRPQG